MLFMTPFDRWNSTDETDIVGASDFYKCDEPIGMKTDLGVFITTNGTCLAGDSF